MQELNAFLAALADPQGAGAVFAAYGASAPLLVHGRVQPRRAVALADFAAAPPCPPLGEPTPLGQSRGVAWFQLAEGCLAVGLAEDGLGWLTLADRREDWSYEHGRLMAIAEASHAEGAGLTTTRSWLELALYRRGHARPPLLTLPDARFGCAGSGVCCDIGFQIDLPPAMQGLVDALGGPTLPVRPDGRLQLKAHGERCRFLDEHKRCTVHAALGRQPFPTCARYPYLFTPTPDGVAVATSSSCGSARANLGLPLAAQAAELHDRLAMEPLRPAPARFFLAKGLEVPWEVFKQAEAGLLAALSQADLPLWDRLWQAERGLLGLLQGREPELAQATEAERKALAGMFGLFNRLLGEDLPATGFVPLPREQEAPLARMLANQLQAKGLSFSYDLLTAQHANMFMAGWACYAASAFPGGRLPDAVLWRLGGTVMHGGLDRALASREPRDATFQQALRSPRFGPWVRAVVS